MPKIVKKYGKTTLVLGLILVMLAMYLVIPTGQAAKIANRSVTITDSRPSQTAVEYIFEGDFSATDVKCIKVQFCANATGTCTPSSITVTGASKGTSGNWSGFVYANWTGGTPDNTDKIMTFTYATGEAGGTGGKFAIGALTNPTSAGTNFARINTYTNVDCSTGATDDGVVAFAIVSGVAVTATVAETLTFTLSQSAVDFGEMGTSAIRYATAGAASGGSDTEPGAGLPCQLTLSTNAASGATITIQDIGDGTTNAGLYSSSATKLIAATGPSTVAGGTESYAPYGKNDGANLTIVAGFQTAGGTAVTRAAQTFITASGPISSGNTADLAVKAGISAATPAATDYADTLILIATPKY